MAIHESQVCVLPIYFCTPPQIAMLQMLTSHVLHFIPILKPQGNQLRRNKTKKLSTGRRPRGRDMQQVLACLDLCLEKPIHMSEGDKKERKIMTTEILACIE